MKIPSDEWETPQWLFDELNKEFNFEYDLCATPKNCKTLYCIGNFLTRVHKIRANCFINPPYSNPFSFVYHAINLVELGPNQTLVMLLKCDPSTKVWALFWDYEKHCLKPRFEIRFLPKRLKYEYKGRAYETAQFPSVIVIKRGIQC